MKKKAFIVEVSARLSRHFGTKAAACDHLGISQSYMNMLLAGKKPVTDKLLAAVREKTGWDYYDPATWEGPPVIDASQNSAVPYSGGFLLTVPLVPSFASAGYVLGYNDETYMENLPRVSFQVDNEPRGNYVAFEVIGESMFDGSFDSYIDGDRILCREVPRHLWRDKLHIRKWDFVIVHRSDGILLKRIIKHDVQAATITAHSINPEFPDQVFHLDDIAQLFNVVRVERRK